jgi:hypothetical protein
MKRQTTKEKYLQISVSRTVQWEGGSTVSHHWTGGWLSSQPFACVLRAPDLIPSTTQTEEI